MNWRRHHHAFGLDRRPPGRGRRGFRGVRVQGMIGFWFIGDLRWKISIFYLVVGCFPDQFIHVYLRHGQGHMKLIFWHESKTTWISKTRPTVLQVWWASEAFQRPRAEVPRPGRGRIHREERRGQGNRRLTCHCRRQGGVDGRLVLELFFLVIQNISK